MQFRFSVSTALVAYLATANAHMKMSSPKPYGASTLNNSPLDPSGSDFPCKLRPGVYDKEGAENILTIGQPQTLSFIGGATHGGGSCQVSLTTDLQPNAGSKWMVIKSIEGGCPSAAPGNLNDDASSTGASTFQYTVPEGIAPGEYTIAWSWINRIGNREFYMNCGPATVVAAKKRYAPAKVVERQLSLPDLFVANLASVNDCKTPESFSYLYPNPGSDVEQAGSGPFTQLVCGAGGGNSSPQSPTATAGGPGGGPSQSAPGQADPTQGFATDSPSQDPPSQVTGTPNQPNQGPPSQTTGSPDSDSDESPSNGGFGSPGVFASDAASAPAPSSTASVPDRSNSDTGVDSNQTTGASGSGSAGAPGTACSPEGAWSCSSDGSSFQRCASGVWSVSMAMTEGMMCSPGVSSNIVMSPGKNKRHLHGHLRRAAAFGGESVH